MQEITRATETPVGTPTRPEPVDAAPESRPGVPREAEPRPDEGAHWDTPPRQEQTVPIMRRKGLDTLTPVFGTAQPPHGLSGLVRWAAYQAPEHQARHWAGLLLADRIDILETRLGHSLGRSLRENGYDRGAEFVERNALPVVAAGVLLAWMLVRRPTRKIRRAGGRARERTVELGREATDRTRDLGRDAGRRGRDLGFGVWERGRDLARQGLELGGDLGRRGQELVEDLGELTGLRKRRRWYNRLGF